MKVTDGARIQQFVGELYETLPGGITKTHLFFGPTRLATITRQPVLLAKAGLDSFLTRSTPRRIHRAFAAVSDFFVGRAYADTTLPAGTKLSFYHPDHLGSVNLITDHNGAQVRLNEFSPFGSLTRGEGSVDAPHKFTGKRLDDSTGLYYFHARYYDPQLGRFIQPDSIVQAPSDPQTLNRYTYARNNPLIYVDPTGKSFWKKVKKFFRKVGDFISPLGRAIVTGEWKHFGIQVLNIIGMVLAPNPFLFAAAFLSYTSTALSDMRGSTWAGIRQGLGYASMALAVVGTGVEVSKAIQSWSAQAAASRNAQNALPGATGTGTLSGEKAASDALTVQVKPFARKLSWTGKRGSHEGWAFADGRPLTDFGPEKGLLKMNVYADLGAGTVRGAPSTFKMTTDAYNAGQLIYGTERTVTVQSLVRGWEGFNDQFIAAGQKYELLAHNSNFSADWFGIQSGMGPAVVPGTWTPGSISDISDN